MKRISHPYAEAAGNQTQQHYQQQSAAEARQQTTAGHGRGAHGAGSRVDAKKRRPMDDAQEARQTTKASKTHKEVVYNTQKSLFRSVFSISHIYTQLGNAPVDVSSRIQDA